MGESVRGIFAVVVADGADGATRLSLGGTLVGGSGERGNGAIAGA